MGQYLELFGLSGTAEYDPYSGNLYYRSGDLGFTVGGWAHLDPMTREGALLHIAKLEERQKSLAESLATVPPMSVPNTYTVTDYRGAQPNLYEKLPVETAPTVKNILDMPMAEYAELRKNYGASTKTGSGGLFAPEPVKQLTKFDLWKNARESYINGSGTLDDMLKYVESDEDGYSRLVDEEIAQERAEREANVRVPKHRFNWRRWSAWRWVASWFHWGNLGRCRHREDYSGPTCRKRLGTARGGSMDFGGF